MTPAQALTRTRTQINETTAAFWSDAEIYGYMWEAESLLAGKLGMFQATTAVTTVTGTSSYTFPSGYQRVSRLTYDGRKLKKGDFTDRDYLDGTSYGSTLQAGKPEMYVEWGGLMYLYPVPDDAKALRFFGLKVPTEITASASFSIPEESIQQMIPDYCVWKCSMKDGEMARGDRHKQAWEANVLRAESIWVDRKAEDRIYAVKDEDEYAGGNLGMD
jgi:hypothetical protein